MRISIPLILAGLFFTLDITHSVEIAPRELAKKNAIKDALQNYKKVESIYVKSNGNLSRSLEFLVSEESTEEDVKFLSSTIAMYGLAPSSSIRVDESQVIVVEKSKKHVIELEGLYDKEIRFNSETLKVDVDFEHYGLERNYNALKSAIKKLLKNEEKKTAFSIFLERLLPRAEALGGVFSKFFQGTGVALTSSSQRYYGGVRVDPSVKSGTGRISAPLPHSQTSNRRYFQNYQAPHAPHSTYNRYNRGPAPVYQKPNGDRIQTWGSPHSSWNRVN